MNANSVLKLAAPQKKMLHTYMYTPEKIGGTWTNIADSGCESVPVML